MVERVVLQVPAQSATQAPSVMLGPRSTHPPQIGGGTKEARAPRKAGMGPLTRADQELSQTDLIQPTIQEDCSTSWITCGERE